jgi:glycosyltransferase involved in cell wall biosynthesis
VLQHGRLGTLVPPGDAAELARAMDTILSDPRSSALVAERARDAVQQRYSSRRMAEQYMVLYKELVEKHVDAPARQASVTAGRP